MEAFLAAAAPVFLRAIGLVAILPLGDGIMLVTRTALALGLTLLYAGHVTVSPSGLTPFGAVFELLLGAVIGLPAALVTECVAMYGELVDNGRGQNQANVYDPLNNQTVSYLALIGKHFAWYALLALGILPSIVASFVESFSAIPTGGGELIVNAAMRVIVYCAEILGTTFVLFLPCAVLFLLVEIAAGCVSKVSTRAGLSGESFLVKTGAVFLLLLGLQHFNLLPSLGAAAQPDLGVLLGVVHG